MNANEHISLVFTSNGRPLTMSQIVIASAREYCLITRMTVGFLL